MSYKILLDIGACILAASVLGGGCKKKKDPVYIPPPFYQDEVAAMDCIANKLQDLGYTVEFDRECMFTDLNTGQPISNRFDVYGFTDLDNDTIPEKEIYVEYNSDSDGVDLQTELALEAWDLENLKPPLLLIQPDTFRWTIGDKIEDADQSYNP